MAGDDTTSGPDDTTSGPEDYTVGNDGATVPIRIVNGHDHTGEGGIFDGLDDEDAGEEDLVTDAFRSIFVQATYMTTSLGVRQLRDVQVNIPVYAEDAIGEYAGIVATTLCTMLERRATFTLNGEEVTLP